MSKFKHTEEPWSFYADKRLGPTGSVYEHNWIIESGTRKLMAVLSVPGINADKKWRKANPGVMKENLQTRREVAANAKRLTDCVNACKGMASPGKTIQELQSVLEEAMLALLANVPGETPIYAKARRRAYRRVVAVLNRC